MLDFRSRSHFSFCSGHGNSQTPWHVEVTKRSPSKWLQLLWLKHEIAIEMLTWLGYSTTVNSLWLSRYSQIILIKFDSLITEVEPRKIESEGRSASKTLNLRISLFTSIKGRHCIQTTHILVNHPAINAKDPTAPFGRIWCELRSVTAQVQQICQNLHHR